MRCRIALTFFAKCHDYVPVFTPHRALSIQVERAMNNMCPCRLEKRYCRLQRQAQAMRQAQQKEQQMMQEFGALAEEHVSATAAPLREARRALGQVR